MVRTGTHSRRVPVHNTLPHRLLHHVREPAFPLPFFGRLTLKLQMDIFEHGRIYRRCQSGLLLIGRRYGQHLPRRRSIRIH